MIAAELVAATQYSFLRGASSPAEMVVRAIELGLGGIGIADRNSVAGCPRAHVALAEARAAAAEAGRDFRDFKLAVGARLVFADGTPDIVAYPATRHGWGRLCRLLTLGNRRAQKGGCLLGLADLLAHLGDLLLIILPETSFCADEAVPIDHEAAAALARVPGARQDERLRWLVKAAPARVWLGARMAHGGADRRRLAARAALAARLGVPLLATLDALYAGPDARPLHDVLTCIRHGVTIASAGRRLAANAERHLKPPEEMTRLFSDYPLAIAETRALLARIDFSLDQLRYEYPREPVPIGWEPQGWLEHLVTTAAYSRHPEGVPGKLRKILDEELQLVARCGYANYFLTVHDLVRFARGQDPPILCQGRGSAANSAVCFLLGITSVDPMQYDLLFSRFVSEERREPPDIDVDFEHERREEVMQYIYRRYGRDRAGIAATVIHYRPRSAVRDVGKALGFTEDVTRRIAETVWGSHARAMDDRRFAESGYATADPSVARLKMLVERILHAPRHLSQHVGGFVLTEGRLDELVPIHNAAMDDRTFIEWDKDDIDALGLMKVDVLALGMLTCIRKSFDLMRAHGLGDHNLEVDLSADDPAVYDMLCRGDSIGVFQVESRAQMNMLPRLRPRKFYDLTVQVAIVRPGPIQGDMVHPYLRRRGGVERVDFPSPAPPHDPDELRQLLGETYGVPLFQEQAMKLAIVAAAFTPGEANQLRRAMATFRRLGGMDKFRDKLVGGMVARGYAQAFAERCYQQIEGFGSYGFPESHALSFARLVYVSSWIKCHHPAVFACALLNAQPMGFYAPAQIVRDAREHGVDVRPIDVNASAWDNRLEPCAGTHPHALRLGFRQLSGFRADWAAAIVAARSPGGYRDIEQVAREAGVPSRALRLIADVDGFAALGINRRDALWEARRVPVGALPLFTAARAREMGAEPPSALPAMRDAEHIIADYQLTRLSLRQHPMALLRADFAAQGVLSCAEVAGAANGRRVRAAGLVLVRQRPGNGNAIFITIEDETGIANIVLWASRFERQRRAVMAARLMLVEAEVQKSPEGVIHLMAARVIDRSAMLDGLGASDEPDDSETNASVPPMPRARHPRDARILPKSRDFH